MNVASHVKISRIPTPVKRPVCHKEPGNNPKVRIVLEYHVIVKLYRHKVGCSGFLATHQLNYVYVLCRLFHPTSEPKSN